MESVRKGLRKDQLYKDTYGRLKCSECEKSLQTKDNPSEVGTTRICPDCGEAWTELR
ncbi:HVO_0758 family zinc finger protein [Halospeciosus flavus]|uniref:HVO_0758 family zinc finger protein n=2 Tax=Halospeciosus flavus TaxID=3032283 RepID=A0ABD5Z677_9EURY|nr:HVO_0758 family zinc finger protein [Halospeciosus flavus]